jgi:hypothetical protein
VLPFARRKKSDEVELGDDDIVVVEEAAVEIDVAELEVVEVAGARPLLPRTAPPPPKMSLRRLVTPRDRFEDDVADECLKSIAAATSQTRSARLSDSFPASIVPPAPRVPHFEASVDELLSAAPLPQFELSDADETARRPALSSSSSMPIARDSGAIPGVRALPPSPPSVSSLPTPVFSRTTSSPALPAASSIAPVSMSSSESSSRSPVEPTVILVRQPPKAAWVVAAAFLGAACALMGMHLLTRSADSPPPIVLAAPPPPVTTQATPASPPAPTPTPTPATVRFNDDQAMAVIAAPAPTVSATPAAKPAVTTAAKTTNVAPLPKPATKPSSLGPKLPDGSMALTKMPSTAPPAAAPSPPPEPAPAPPPGPKRRLTPEQELAEAQLKASMR